MTAGGAVEGSVYRGKAKNIERDPRVRVKVGSRWFTGHARIREDEDAEERLRELRRPVNDAMLRLVSTERLVIRVDLNRIGFTCDA